MQRRGFQTTLWGPQGQPHIPPSRSPLQGLLLLSRTPLPLGLAGATASALPALPVQGDI